MELPEVFTVCHAQFDGDTLLFDIRGQFDLVHHNPDSDDRTQKGRQTRADQVRAHFRIIKATLPPVHALAWVLLDGQQISRRY